MYTHTPLSLTLIILGDVTPCRYKLLELLGYVAMGAGPALVILSMVTHTHHRLSRNIYLKSMFKLSKEFIP
jgi:hypothetical protein